MASLMLEMAGEKSTMEKVTNILDSGLAYQKMKEIIKAQNGNPEIKIQDLLIGPYKYSFKSDKSGIISYISNEIISKIARIAGAPSDKSAGIFMNIHYNDFVKKKHELFTVYSKSKDKLDYAVNFLKNNNPISIK
jgi:AMP phosphorylase